MGGRKGGGVLKGCGGIITGWELYSIYRCAGYRSFGVNHCTEGLCVVTGITSLMSLPAVQILSRVILKSKFDSG